jgi:hypothetical protein
VRMSTLVLSSNGAVVAHKECVGEAASKAWESVLWRCAASHKLLSGSPR